MFRKKSLTKEYDNVNVDMHITSKDMINELTEKNTIYEDPELKTEIQDSEMNKDSDFNKSPVNISGKKVLYQKQENVTLKTQGTIIKEKNFDSFDKSKVPTNTGN